MGGSDKKWVRRQADDPFVRQRKRSGIRSRAFFKFEELNKRDKVLYRGDNVIDLGAAPGGWSQSAARIVGTEGRVLAIDSRNMDEIENVTFLRGICGHQEIMTQAQKVFGPKCVDLVISDLAPNISGIRLVDEATWRSLVLIAGEYVDEFLKSGGNFVVKFFQFEDTEEVIADLKKKFSRVKRRKPESSRKESREFFIVAKGFRV